MTEHDQSPDDPRLAPQLDAEVRRLLLDARHTEPTPAAVVARLDRVLAGLADEPTREATVVRLADRRRRATAMLFGAAASVAAVIGVGQLLSPAGQDEASTSAEAGPASDAEAGADAAESADDLTGGARERMTAPQAPYAVRSDDFARDADVLRSQAPGAATDEQGDGSTAEGAPEGAPRSATLRQAPHRVVCEPGRWGGGQYVAVLYDRAEGWVVLRRPRGDTQVADLFLCGSEVVVRSVTLPYP